MADNTAIRTEQLTKSYGTVRALNDLTLEVMQGEIFGFLGPNGAGKTTAIRLLLDLIRPTAGHAEVLGFDCQRQSHEVRARVGYLPGELRLYPNLTGNETVALISGLRGHAVEDEIIAGLAERLSLDLGQRVGAYSKGNRQKLGLVLALLDRAPLLLLDEPTSGLDPVIQHEVWNLLREEAQLGTAVFFSSHVMSEVEQVCERVAILRRGNLVEVASVVALRGEAVRHVEVTFAAPAPNADAFRAPGVREIRREHSTLEFEVTGEIGPLLRALAPLAVVDLRTEQPTLEEALLRFYRDAP